MSRTIETANKLTPGSVTHPGSLIKDELSARGMKQIELSKAMGIAKNVMSEIINGKRNITPESAVKLEIVLGIKAEFWMKYQVAYQLHQIRTKNESEIHNR